VATGTGINASAFGANSAALSDFGTAIGANSLIEEESHFGTTLGANTHIGPKAPGAVAIGVNSAGKGAEALLENQFVLGTNKHTYTAPGITSSLSKDRQKGPLELVTSDTHGNLATDNGRFFARLDNLEDDVDTNQEGIAIAMASVGPDLTGNERYGLSLNWGNFEGANAIGGGFTAVVRRGQRSRLAVTGGIGVGFDEGSVGGRIGGQWTR
jgi:hypothetical protein